MTRKLILLPGMTPDRRIFRKLSPLLEMDHVVMDWIAPGTAKTIREYARMLADTIDIHPGSDIAGVSFGGMVARELAGLVGARLCFVISSVSSSSELRPFQRWQGTLLPKSANLALLGMMGAAARACPGCVSNASTAGARRYGGSSGPWFRWVTIAASRWQPDPNPCTRVIRIHGDRDRTFPRGHLGADHVVPGAGHMLALTHCTNLAEIMRLEIQAEA